ncbi:hypothetical protein WJX81_004737 [Elliptochloris bilobata]|uniref:ferredoxin--NADP(+) reductase n=1 Tax=Elliptochloris bilobata TaxID=381761 RepID=A0AAW1QJ64_9CHLO
MEVQRVAEWSLLLRWEGRDSALQPGLCISHLDVVPAGDAGRWTHPPFSGAVQDGYVWGRGAIDVKFGVTALLEAVSQLLRSGFKPERTLLLAFGHDEEVGGLGAAATAALLQAIGTELAWILDEGGPVLQDGMRPFLPDGAALALVGTAEKGEERLELEVFGRGGHASMPPRHGSAALDLVRALAALERSQDAPRLVEPVPALLQALGSGARGAALRWVLRSSRSWPVRAVLARVLAAEASGETAALVRSTLALTQLDTPGAAGNVVPVAARARFNARLLPGTRTLHAPSLRRARLLPGDASMEPRLRKRIQAILGDDVGGQRWRLTRLSGRPASTVAPADGRAFELVRRAAQETLTAGQALVVAPFLLVAATDSRHYTHLAGGRGALRFLPAALNRTAGDLRRVHGIDERLAVTRRPVPLELEKGDLPMNTFNNKKAFKATVKSVERIVGPKATGETCHIIIETRGEIPFWEGQSYGIIPPGTKVNSKGKEVPHGARLYSIAASRYGDNFDGQTTSLCVRRATYWCPEMKAEDPAKKGLCSNFLCDAKPGDEVTMTGPTGKILLMPEDPNAVFIMVATGTGIAPYRSFLRRMFLEDVPNYKFTGLAWLFMGVANSDAKLYDDEFQDILNTYPDQFRLDYALSREQTNQRGGKMYIQDKVEEYSDEVFDLLDNGAHIYFCGLKGMMPGIQEMLERVSKEKGMVWEEFFGKLKSNSQWHVEVY